MSFDYVCENCKYGLSRTIPYDTEAEEICPDCGSVLVLLEPVPEFKETLLTEFKETLLTDDELAFRDYLDKLPLDQQSELLKVVHPLCPEQIENIVSSGDRQLCIASGKHMTQVKRLGHCSYCNWRD